MICVEQFANVAGMKTMGDRLREAREEAGFKSAAKAAEALGVSASSYRAHENGQNDYDPEAADQYARKFNTTAGYLLTGNGPRKSGRSGLSLISSYDPEEQQTEQGDASASYSREHWRPAVDGAIPEIDVKLGAGSGVVGDVINLSVGAQTFSAHPVVAEWLIPEDYLRKEAKASPAQTLIMEIIGDSMTPTYQPGDRVMIDLGQNQMSTDTVYAISDGRTEPQIKRLQRVPFSEPAQVIIISDNQNLERFTVELERLSIIGRVCGHIARR
jgi:phage repressor protein C with HTH and peptisase S24 domain